MTDIKRILCPIDFSPCSRRALDHAVALAGWHGAAVTALHAFMGGPVLGPAYLEAAHVTQMTDAERAELGGQVEAFVAPSRRGEIPVETRLAEGQPASQIVRQADELAVDLVVMGTHGRGVIERLLIGSVTERVLKRTTRPVLTIPSEAGGPTTPVQRFQRIFCAIDFSASSLRALRYALRWGKGADATLILHHVLELGESEFIQFTVKESLDELARQGRERLEASVPPEARSWCAIEPIVTTGKSYIEILRLAAEHRADLIVMGTHGPSPLNVMRFGSTTDHVVREATVPVLSLRAAS